VLGAKKLKRCFEWMDETKKALELPSKTLHLMETGIPWNLPAMKYPKTK
jgi:hypothetical protein